MSIKIEASAGEGEKGRVLICDDSSTIRTIIEGILTPEFECLAVPSAEDALERAPDFRPDLILSDLMMDGMDGLELCERVRRDPLLQQVPVVLMTTKADEEGRAMGLEAGADDYLFKPIRSRELLARVRGLHRLRRSVGALANRTEQLEHANRSLKDAQEALVRSEKLATVGTLVAGIAHEINNPLAFMSVGAEHMVEYVQDMVEHIDRLPTRSGPELERTAVNLESTLKEMKEIAQEIGEGVHRIARISGDLKAFAKSNGGEPTEIDLGVEVRRAWAMAVLRVRVRPELVIEAEPLPHFVCQAHQLGQVLLNLLVNAVQAINGPGTVTVSCVLDPTGWAISVRDSGPGISPQNLSRIFDPFFTTKPPGQGTGLGLSVSFGILQGLGGRLDVESPPGKGATFVIRLPRTPLGDQYNATRSPNAEPGIQMSIGRG